MPIRILGQGLLNGQTYYQVEQGDCEAYASVTGRRAFSIGQAFGMTILSAWFAATMESILNRHTFQWDPSLTLYLTSVRTLSLPVFLSHLDRIPATNVLAAIFSISAVTRLITLA